MFHPSHSGLRALFKAEASFFQAAVIGKRWYIPKEKKNCTWNVQICTKIGFEKSFFFSASCRLEVSECDSEPHIVLEQFEEGGSCRHLCSKAVIAQFMSRAGEGRNTAVSGSIYQQLQRAVLAVFTFALRKPLFKSSPGYLDFPKKLSTPPLCQWALCFDQSANKLVEEKIRKIPLLTSKL